MLKYPCLVLDHDDTVVQSEATVNYPCFCLHLQSFRPGASISLEQYADGCFRVGFSQMCRELFGFTDEELHTEYLLWREYIKTHIPSPYAGVERIIRRQKEEGGILCVVSHSSEENITRDYRKSFSVLPDAIYGWDYPEHQRKPSTFPLEHIMKTYGFKPEELLVVDDMKPGCDMAKNAGVSIAFAGWGRKSFPEIYRYMREKCDFSFDTAQELEAFLFD